MTGAEFCNIFPFKILNPNTIEIHKSIPVGCVLHGCQPYLILSISYVSGGGRDVSTVTLLPFIALSVAQSSAQTRIHSAILVIDTSNNASYNQVHWLVRTSYLSIKASNAVFNCISYCSWFRGFPSTHSFPLQHLKCWLHISSGRQRSNKSERPCCLSIFLLLPPANKVGGKVMFLLVSVIMFTGGSLSRCS